MMESGCHASSMESSCNMWLQWKLRFQPIKLSLLFIYFMYLYLVKMEVVVLMQVHLKTNHQNQKDRRVPIWHQCQLQLTIGPLLIQCDLSITKKNAHKKTVLLLDHNADNVDPIMT